MTDGGFLTVVRVRVFLGWITKAISLDSVFAFICIMRSDWLTDPSLPEKFIIPQLSDAGNGGQPD